jgi:colanic acid/amylovoran biosynthesis protein
MDRQINALFVGNGPNSNRGCEAIINGTVEILTKSFKKIKCTNVYDAMKSEPVQRMTNGFFVQHKPMRVGYKGILDRAVKGQMLKYLPALWSKIFLNELRKHIKQSDIVLSLGGDNYSMDYGIPRRFIQQGKLAKKYRKPFVIFGASVGPFDGAGTYKKVIEHHLRNEVDLILVRENRSYNYLKAIGCKNIMRMTDPAFVMLPHKPDNPTIPLKILQEAIGLNISPLIAKLNPRGRENPADWIRQIISELKNKLQRPIVLIYHVTARHTDDRNLMENAYQQLQSTDNIYLLESNLNAKEIKWYISQLSCLVAARTHATIAGFSSCIPTISLAYSVKAWGINEDLFGNTNYVIAAEDIDGEKIANLVQKAISEREQVHLALLEKTRSTKKQAYSAGSNLKKLLDGPGY